jgi:predicted HAD superfamily phosphohydrolase YqeG
MAKTICLDFDGVLNTYDGWKGEDNLFEPRKGAKDFVNDLITRGFKVVIHSTRKPEKIEKWLVDNNFPPIEVHATKPPAVAYLDDRAVTFTGYFNIALFNLIKFKPYWEK